MDRVARAIAEPRRREILSLVRDDELSAGEIASRFDVSRPAVSQHLAVLREAGLLSERREGTRRLYRARPEALAGLRDFLNKFWTDRLERLKLAAELEQQRRDKRGKRRDRDAVEVEVRIGASPETVFDFFTDPDKMIQWMGRSAELDPRPGGALRCDINGDNVASGEYVELDPPRRVVFTWGWEGEDSVTTPGSSTIEVLLEPDGDGTHLRLIHRDLPSRRIGGETRSRLAPLHRAAGRGGGRRATPAPTPGPPEGADDND